MLLALPDPCLLAVLQFCEADDQRSLFRAATAHSKLHRVAVSILRSLKAVVGNHQHLVGVLHFLRNHGQHIDSVSIRSTHSTWDLDGPDPDSDEAVCLYNLPSNLHLSTLQLDTVFLPEDRLRLRPGQGLYGVLTCPAVASLKQLQLYDCELLDGGDVDALRLALEQLPKDLEHLSLRNLLWNSNNAQLDTSVLERLLELTHLELAGFEVLGPFYDLPVLQPLQELTKLADLRLEDLFEEGAFGTGSTVKITASMLSGTQGLTCLEVSGKSIEERVMEVEPGVLAGKTQLQHLLLQDCRISGAAAGAAQLLLHLQPLQQLTTVSLGDSLNADWEGSPPAAAAAAPAPAAAPPAAAAPAPAAAAAPAPAAAAYAALTASNKLACLDLRRCTLPEGVWQHVFPAGRQLAHLQELDISEVYLPNRSLAAAPEGSRLVSCCSGLQMLNMQHLTLSAELIAQLPALTGLTALELRPEDGTYGSMGEGLEAVCQLTGLRELTLCFEEAAGEGLLLQLTQLKQLTRLEYRGPVKGRLDLVLLARMVSPTPVDQYRVRHLAR